MTPNAASRQGDLHPDQGVLAAVDARTRAPALGSRLTAEEGVHDVGEGEPGAEAGRVAEDVATAVVGRPLLRVAEDLVGARRSP